MRRRVWFDTTSRAAAAAAPLLGEQFDVAALPAGPIAGPAVILTGADGTGRLPDDDGQLRVLGLVDAVNFAFQPGSSTYRRSCQDWLKKGASERLWTSRANRG